MAISPAIALGIFVMIPLWPPPRPKKLLQQQVPPMQHIRDASSVTGKIVKTILQLSSVHQVQYMVMLGALEENGAIAMEWERRV